MRISSFRSRKLFFGVGRLIAPDLRVPGRLLASALAGIALTGLIGLVGGCEKRVVRGTAYHEAQFEGAGQDVHDFYTEDISPRMYREQKEAKQKGPVADFFDDLADVFAPKERRTTKPGYRAF